MKRIAKEMGISLPTLRKHYFHSSRVAIRLAREMAIAEMRARNMLRLDKLGDEGSVPAINALEKILDRSERDLVEREVGADAPREKSQGVKRQRELMGYEADDDLERELMQEADGRVH